MDKIPGILYKGLVHSVIHPRSRICFCSNPKKITQNPIPWQVNIGCLLISVGMWCLANKLGIPDMAKAALVLFGAAVGSLYGMSVSIRNTKVNSDGEHNEPGK